MLASKLRFVVALGGVAVLIPACVDLGKGVTELTGAACPELGGTDAVHASYAANEQVNVKLRAFIQASKELGALAAQAEAETAQACARMGQDLGIPPAQLQPQGGASGSQQACGVVGNAIDQILRSGVQIHVTATPPACQATGEAYAQCSGTCGAQVDPGQIIAHCAPGKLSGVCQGQCGGHCDGRCTGQCIGQCTAFDAMGRCVGQCSGDCHGTCEATCHAQCSGTWQAPKCEASVQGPSVDAECDASCKAHASFTATCTPAQVTVQTPPNVQLGARLAATLQANLPALLHAQIALGKRVLADAEILAQVGGNLPNLIGQASAHAAACVAASAQSTIHATASVHVSVQASASVSGRVGAGS